MKKCKQCKKEFQPKDEFDIFCSQDCKEEALADLDNDSNNYRNDDDNYRLSFTYRKYLGVDCKTINENVKIKQQLELMKMCGRVNANPSLAQNENFRLLVMKCRGVTPARDNTRPGDSKSLWDDMKDGYKKENPDLKLMNDKIIGPSKSKLKMPPKDYILPLPKPKIDD